MVALWSKPKQPESKPVLSGICFAAWKYRSHRRKASEKTASHVGGIIIAKDTGVQESAWCRDALNQAPWICWVCWLERGAVVGGQDTKPGAPRWAVRQLSRDGSWCLPTRSNALTRWKPDCPRRALMDPWSHSFSWNSGWIMEEASSLTIRAGS